MFAKELIMLLKLDIITQLIDNINTFSALNHLVYFNKKLNIIAVFC